MGMVNTRGRENTGRSSVSKWIAEEALLVAHVQVSETLSY
jgi:hypothetical protein